MEAVVVDVKTENASFLWPCFKVQRKAVMTDGRLAKVLRKLGCIAEVMGACAKGKSDSLFVVVGAEHPVGKRILYPSDDRLVGMIPYKEGWASVLSQTQEAVAAEALLRAEAIAADMEDSQQSDKTKEIPTKTHVASKKPSKRRPNPSVLQGGAASASPAEKCRSPSESSDSQDRKRRPNTSVLQGGTASVSLEINPRSPSESSDSQDHESETTKLIVFKHVKQFLTKVGFTFRKNMYCRPQKDPDLSDAVLGEDYFKTEDEFRRNLCAYNLNYENEWSDRTKERISNWVKYSIVDSIDSTTTSIKEVPALSFAEAIVFLKKVGMKIDRKFGEEYVLPLNSGGHRKFSCQSDFEHYVSRFGFGEFGLKFDRLDKDSVMRIQCLFAGANRDVFAPVEDVMYTDSDEQSSSLSTCISTRSGRTLTPSPRKRPFSSPCSSSSKARRVSNGLQKHTANKQPLQSTPQDLDLSLPFQRLPSSIEEFKPPVFQGTDRERLEKTIEALDLKAKVDLSLFKDDRDTPLLRNLNSINDFLLAVVETGGESGDLLRISRAGLVEELKPAALYVCGIPGSGKTLAVSHCCENAASRYQAQIVYVGACHLKTKSSAFEFIAKELGCGNSTNAIRSRLRTTTTVVVLVIDEVDLMLNGRRQDLRDFLKLALGWANDADLRCAAIAISNSVGNDRYAELMEIGKFKESRTFTPYSANDIERLLELRVGHETVDKRVLAAVAKNAASQNGDARKALLLAQAAVRERLKTVQGADETTGPLVTVKHFRSALASQKGTVMTLVSGLPVQSKVVLSILMILEKNHVETTTESTREYVQSCLNETNRIQEWSTKEDFELLLENLVDSGLIMKGTRPGCTDPTTYLNLTKSVDDIEKALTKETLQFPFYARLQEKAVNLAREIRKQQ